jgi:hypothetical protein
MMRKMKLILPSAIAILAATVVTVVLVEDTIVLLGCILAALAGITVAAVRCIHSKHSRLRALAVTLAPVIIFIAIAWSHLPLRLTFRALRPQFEHAASQIEAGTPPATPFWIGPFKIKMAGRRGDSGTPYLASNEETSEINGFVRHPDGHGFNLWSCITLDDAWSYIAED